MKRYIFTGTPGSGKTSVIQALKQKGYSVVPEAATDLIIDAQKSGVMEPWAEPAFIELITLHQKQRQLGAMGKLQFHDRSPLCTYALGCFLSRFHDGDFTPPTLLKEIDRCLKKGIYQDKVFFFEKLGFIENTDVRKISYEEALIFEEIHFRVYDNIGFDIVIVPKGSIEERCQFILRHTQT